MSSYTIYARGKRPSVSPLVGTALVIAVEERRHGCINSGHRRRHISFQFYFVAVFLFCFPHFSAIRCQFWYFFITDITFGYPNQPKLFVNLDFGIDLNSRGEVSSHSLLDLEMLVSVLKSLIFLKLTVVT